MRKKIAAALLASTVFLTSCQLPFQEKEGDGSGFLFTYTLTENPDSLDPQIARNDAAFMVLHNMMQGLVEEQPDGSITYGVSSHYSVSEDGRTYTFTLRDSAQWYWDKNKNERIDEGETWRVTSEDFVFAFQRMFNPETRSPHRETFSCIRNAGAILRGETDYRSIGVTALNENTLSIELDRRCDDFLSRLALPAAMPCSREFFEATQGRYGRDEDSVISNSSFYLRRWFYDPYGSDNLIYLQENSANNTVQKVYPSDVTFLIRSYQEDAENAFRSGKSDILATQVPDEAFEDSELYTVESWFSLTMGLVFNPEHETFANRDIRQALSMTIPRGDLNTEDVQGASSIIPPASYVGDAPYNAQVVAGKLSTGNQIEAKSHYNDGIHALGLQALKAENLLVCENTIQADLLYAIVQNWQALFGFYAGIEVVPEEEYWQRLAEKDYAIALYTLSGTSRSALSLLEDFRPENNAFHYDNSELTALLDAAKATSDTEETVTLIQRMEQMLLDEMLFVPVLYKKQYLVYRNENRDISYDPFSGVIQFRTAKHYEN